MSCCASHNQSAQRELFLKHQVDGSGEVTLASYAYDNLGRLQSKSLHGSAANKQSYTYNVRSWLTGISGTKFTQNLYYNTGTGAVKYNGSISSMTWQAGDESTVRGYKFTYDGIDRMLTATYGETAGINTNTNRFSENVTAYDKNGNRLVFSQDGNQRALTSGNWTYYKYDGLNRLTEQGTCTNKVTTSGTNVLVQHFYDSYAFRSQAGFNNSNFPDDASGNGKGALTASVATVLGSSNKIYTAYYYDIKGRVAKTVQSNLLGSYDVTATIYTFTDKPATVTHTHTTSGKPTRTEMYTYSYNHADRLLKVEHTLGGTKITLADYAYDNLGRLQSKSLHGSATNKLTYAYNVRGWLTGISGSKFTQNLYYNNGNGTAKYNGSISSMTWKAGNESTVRGYKFTYDGLDRMLNATYGETAGISTNANRFSENVTGYDKNGNIKTLQRYGQTAASGYGLIDNLTFTLGGNQLTRVDDAVATSAYNNGFEFKDGVKQANEYNYDSNGNLTKDLNKGITNISYNCLNLPSVVTFSDGSTVTYTYAAGGTKLKTVHKTGSTTTTTDYCGNVVYENGVQKLLLTDEGYVTLSDSKYHYYLKDHQGNNRVVINQSGTVEETNHYYPFGGVFASAGNVQPYKYNGKEYDGKKGLNWYDYGARMYDAALGRFMTVDPLAEKYYPMSPYGYCLNNPIKFIDADGRLPRIYIERKGFGHAFVTVGNGDNTIVYTYGRYGELGKDKSSARNTSPTGEGVLIKLTGRDAISFIQDQMLANEAVGYEFTKGSDELVSKHFDKQLDNSNKIPQKGKYAGKENAKVIDEYNLFINNCATTSIKGIQEGVKKDLDLKDSKAPASLGDRLKVMSKEDEHSIRRITYNEIKKEFNLHGAGTKW